MPYKYNVFTGEFNVVESFIPLTDGQVVIGSSTGPREAANITAGANITITNGPNSIIIDADEGAGITFDSDIGNTQPVGDAITFAGGVAINTAATPGIITINLDSPVIVENGGSGRDDAIPFAVICGGSTNTNPHQSIVSVGSDNQVLTSNGSFSLPTFQDASHPFTWNKITGNSQIAAVNNGYITDNIDIVTITLPISAAVGDIISVAGEGGSGWTIEQNPGQSISFSSKSTTSGITGSLSATDTHDSVELLCTDADTFFSVISSIGNILII